MTSILNSDKYLYAALPRDFPFRTARQGVAQNQTFYPTDFGPKAHFLKVDA